MSATSSRSDSPTSKRRASIESNKSSGGTIQLLTPEATAVAPGFDEQFFQPDLYQHNDSAAEAENLLPYPTIIEVDTGELRVPGPLNFVQSSCFLLLSGSIVVINMAVLYMQVEIGEGNDVGLSLRQLIAVDEICLVFYICEVLLRLAHFKCWFFYHTLDAIWNVFDIVIVTFGIIDAWILPLFASEQEHAHEPASLPILRGIRVFRFLRLMKLVGVMLRSDFRWTNSVWFNSLASIVIILSIVIMGWETDVKSPLWASVDSLVLGFFFFEVVVRLRRQGLHFFVEEGVLWNWLDLCIVVFGVFDQWLLNLWMSMVQGEQRSSELGDILLLIRMLRLLRILRLLRLVKAVRPLYLLALGIVEAMQSMFWVLVLTFVTLFSVAVLMTRLVGHGDMFDDPSEIPAVTKELFANVPASMFTLFVLMNGEEWRKVEPLLARSPFMKLIFVVFTILTSWALLSVMTGVVSDNMISSKKTQNQKDDVIHCEHQARISGVLDELYNAAGAQGTGRLSKDRYFMLMDMPVYARKLTNALPNSSAKDLRDLFLWLDSDDSGEVGKAEFARGLHTLTEPLTGKALLYTDAELKHRFRELHSQVSMVAGDLMAERKMSSECYRSLIQMLQIDSDRSESRSPTSPNGMDSPASASATLRNDML